MMELKVWVDGIQRVVCGATFDTTCQDVVIALAHAMGRTGRFTLIEKWRDNDRPLTPAECPLQVLHKWGEYAAEVRFILCQAETNHHKQSSRDKLVKKGSDIPGYSPNFAVFPRVQGIVGEGNVKRSSTFSGAHNQAGDVSSWLNSSAPTSKLRKTHLGPVPNGDVRQPASSAFTPHPSAQPRHQAGLGGGAVERGLQPSSDHHASTQQDPHHPIPPPRRRASPSLPQQNKDNLRNSASSSVPSSLSSSSDHHYHQQQQHQQANSSRGGGVSSHPQPPQHSPRSHPPPSHPPSSHPTLSHPPPLQQSGSHPQPFPHGIQSHPGGQGPSHPGGQGPSHPQPQPRHPPHHPQSHPHPQPHSRSAQSQGQVQGPNQRTLSQPHSQPQSLPHSQPHSQPYTKAPSPQPPPLPSSPPPTQPSPSPRHGPRDSLVAEEASLDPRYGPRDSLVAEEATLDSPSNLSRQASLEIEEYDLDRNFPDTHRDANRNGRPSVSLEYRLEDGVGSGSVGQGRGHGQGQVQMEGEHAKLLRLVNMQQERLKTQESQIGLVNTEITTLEEKEKEYEDSLQTIMEELLLCENRGRDLEPQLNDLEKVEWENVLDGEKKCEVDITLQIVTYKAKVLEKEHELEDVKKKEGELLEELKAEEKNISQERERLKEEGIRAREKEDKTRGHITQMQSEFVQLQQRAAECESSLSEVDGELKSAEKDLETRTQVLDDLEESLKDENLKDFAANPPPKEADPTAKVKDSGEAIIKILEGRLSPRLNPSVSDKASDNPSTPPFIAALASKNQSGVWV